MDEEQDDHDQGGVVHYDCVTLAYPALSRTGARVGESGPK